MPFSQTKTACCALLSACLCSAPQLAAETVRIGDLRIEYNAFNSSFLQPQIAKAAQAPRGPDIGLISLAARRLREGKADQAISVAIEGTVFNLLQRIPLEFREIRSGKAIYYLASFRFNHRETLYFEIKVQPKSGRGQTLRFEKTLFKDDR